MPTRFGDGPGSHGLHLDPRIRRDRPERESDSQDDRAEPPDSHKLLRRIVRNEGEAVAGASACHLVATNWMRDGLQSFRTKRRDSDSRLLCHDNDPARACRSLSHSDHAPSLRRFSVCSMSEYHACEADGPVGNVTLYGWKRLANRNIASPTGPGPFSAIQPIGQKICGGHSGSGPSHATYST